MESDCERVLDVLDRLGVEYKREHDNRAKICCPFHDEKTASMTIYDTNSCYCFGCQRHCFHDQLIAELAKCSLVEAKKMLGTYDPDANYLYTSSGDGPKKWKDLNIYEYADQPKDFTQSFNKLSKEVPECMSVFLQGKALDGIAQTLGQWRWHPKGTFNCWKNQEGIAIPYFSADGKICTFRLRRYDRMRQRFEHPLAPKGVPLQCSYLMHNHDSPVFFCEGESDSLSVYSTGRNVICLPGVGAHKQLHSAIKQCFEWGIPALFFCGDNDEAGQKFNSYAESAAVGIGKGEYVQKSRGIRIPEEYNLSKEGSYKRKDLNDFLKEGRLNEILNNIEKSEYRGHIQQSPPKTEPISVASIMSIMGGGEEINLNMEGVF